MKRMGFTYIVKADFAVPEEVVDYLIELSKSHYDYKCRYAGVPGPGGFLNGMKNTAENGLTQAHLGSGEFGLIFKILESPFHNRPEISQAFWAIYQVLCDESARLNNERNLLAAVY